MLPSDGDRLQQDEHYWVSRRWDVEKCPLGVGQN